MPQDPPSPNFPQFDDLCREARDMEKRLLPVKPRKMEDSLELSAANDLFPPEFAEYTYAYFLSEAQKIERKLFVSSYPQGQQPSASPNLEVGEKELEGELHRFASSGKPEGGSAEKKGLKLPQIKVPSIPFGKKKSAPAIAPKEGEAPMRRPSGVPPEIRFAAEAEADAEVAQRETEARRAAARPAPRVPRIPVAQQPPEPDEEREDAPAGPQEYGEPAGEEEAPHPMEEEKQVQPEEETPLPEPGEGEELRSEEEAPTPGEGSEEIPLEPPAPKEDEGGKFEQPPISQEEGAPLPHDEEVPIPAPKTAEEKSPRPRPEPKLSPRLRAIIEEKLRREEERAALKKQEEESARQVASEEKAEESRSPKKEEPPAPREEIALSSRQRMLRRMERDEGKEEEPQAEEKPEAEPATRFSQSENGPISSDGGNREEEEERLLEKELPRRLIPEEPEGGIGSEGDSIRIKPIFAGEGEGGQAKKQSLSEEDADNERLARIQRIVEELSPDKYKAAAAPKAEPEKEIEQPETQKKSRSWARMVEVGGQEEEHSPPEEEEEEPKLPAKKAKARTIEDEEEALPATKKGKLKAKKYGEQVEEESPVSSEESEQEGQDEGGGQPPKGGPSPRGKSIPPKGAATKIPIRAAPVQKQLVKTPAVAVQKKPVPAPQPQVRPLAVAAPGGRVRILPGGVAVPQKPVQTYVPPARQRPLQQMQPEIQEEPLQAPLRRPVPAAREKPVQAPLRREVALPRKPIPIARETPPPEPEGEEGAEELPPQEEGGAEQEEPQAPRVQQPRKEAIVPRQRSKEIYGQAALPQREEEELDVPKPPAQEEEPIPMPQDYEAAKEEFRKKVQQEQETVSAQQHSEDELEQHAKENLVWLYEIYKMGGISREDFLQKVRDKLGEGAVGQALEQEAPDNPALANINKEIDKRYKK